jgi:ADP-ribose pyrophosphatase YjhB (NUDIX family)
LNEAERRTYLGAYALCVRSDQVLLARLSRRSDDPDRWTLPGGGVEWGEDPKAAVLRELGEETGLTGEITEILGVYSGIVDRTTSSSPAMLHYVGLLFLVQAQNADLQFEANGTTDKCLWTPIDQADSLGLVPLASYALTLLKERHQASEPYAGQLSDH